MELEANSLTEAQREAVRLQQARRMRQWVEERVWELCDDVAGRGCTTLEKFSDAEIAAYVRGVRHTLYAVLERWECQDLAILTLVDGALGERHHRRYSTGAYNPRSEYARTGYARRMFGNLVLEIRAHRVAMLDEHVTFDYPRWSAWQKRVWAIERKGVEREHWDEFGRLQHELKALMSLSNRLVSCEDWRNKNWAWRKTQEVKEAA